MLYSQLNCVLSVITLVIGAMMVVFAFIEKKLIILMSKRKFKKKLEESGRKARNKARREIALDGKIKIEQILEYIKHYHNKEELRQAIVDKRIIQEFKKPSNHGKAVIEAWNALHPDDKVTKDYLGKNS